MTDEEAFTQQKLDMGTDLLALVMSWQMRTTYQTQRKRLKGREDATDPSWGELAWQLQCGLVNRVASSVPR